MKLFIAFNLEYFKGLFSCFIFSAIRILVIRNPLSTKNISTPIAPKPILLIDKSDQNFENILVDKMYIPVFANIFIDFL